MQTTANQAPATVTSPATPSTFSIVTVEVLAKIHAPAGKTSGAIRSDIFKAEDRVNSRGEKIAGNGLAAHDAIVRRGRKVLVLSERYADWLAGRPPQQSTGATA